MKLLTTVVVASILYFVVGEDEVVSEEYSGINKNISESYEYLDEEDNLDVLLEDDEEGCMPRRQTPTEYEYYDEDETDKVTNDKQSRAQRPTSRRSKAKKSKTQRSERQRTRRNSRTKAETESKSRTARSIDKSSWNQISPNCVEEFQKLKDLYEEMEKNGQVQKCKKNCNFEDLMKVRPLVIMSNECMEQGRRFYQ